MKLSRKTYLNRKTGKTVHEVKFALPWAGARFLFRYET